MSTLILITTVPDRETGLRIARALVEGRLAACVNVLAPCTSIYRWKDQIEESGETPLLIKTREEIFEDVAAAIKRLHPYELPEIVAVPIQHGSAEYLEWIYAATVTEIG